MNQLKKLDIFTRAVYLKEQSAMQDVLAKETALRTQLSKLDQQLQNANNVNAKTLPMQSIGADILWLAWVGRTKARLNLQLAQVLAEKSQIIGRVKKAFGKNLVTEKLVQVERVKILQKQQAQMLASAISVTEEPKVST